MTIEQTLSLISIAVAVGAPVGQVLFDRFLQRRDAHRESATQAPSTEPSPSKFARVLVRVTIYCLPAGVLATQVLSPLPLTRMSVFVISLSVSSILSLILFEFFRKVLLAVIEVQQRSNEIHGRSNEIQRGLLESQKDLLHTHKAHVAITKQISEGGARSRHSKANSRGTGRDKPGA